MLWVVGEQVRAGCGFLLMTRQGPMLYFASNGKTRADVVTGQMTYTRQNAACSSFCRHWVGCFLAAALHTHHLMLEVTTHAVLGTMHHSQLMTPMSRSSNAELFPHTEALTWVVLTPSMCWNIAGDTARAEHECACGRDVPGPGAHFHAVCAGSELLQHPVSAGDVVCDSAHVSP